MTMTTLLTLTAMFGSVRSSVPRVSYISLLDIWMFMCIVFVFIVIIHFVVVISLLRYGHKKAAEAVEIVGALLVPILFIMFNVFYWLNLLHHSGNNENSAKDDRFTNWSWKMSIADAFQNFNLKNLTCVNNVYQRTNIMAINWNKWVYGLFDILFSISRFQISIIILKHWNDVTCI